MKQKYIFTFKIAKNCAKQISIIKTIKMTVNVTIEIIKISLNKQYGTYQIK